MVIQAFGITSLVGHGKFLCSFFVMCSSYPVLVSFFGFELISCILFWLQTHFMTIVICLCIPFMLLNSFALFFLAVYSTMW